MTKPTKCLCAQRRLKSAWASTQSDQSLLCNQWVAKDLSFLHVDSEDSDQTGRMPRLIRVFAGRTVILLVLSWCCSLKHETAKLIHSLHPVLEPEEKVLIHTSNYSCIPNNYFKMLIFEPQHDKICSCHMRIKEDTDEPSDQSLCYSVYMAHPPITRMPNRDQYQKSIERSVRFSSRWVNNHTFSRIYWIIFSETNLCKI